MHYAEKSNFGEFQVLPGGDGILPCADNPYVRQERARQVNIGAVIIAVGSDHGGQGQHQQFAADGKVRRTRRFCGRGQQAGRHEVIRHNTAE